MTYFISEVLAQETLNQPSTPQNKGFELASFIPLILIFAVFYFLIIRPQSKKIKEHQKFVDNLKIGNKIITNSGIIGFIKEIDDKENIVEIEIADGVVIKILRNCVMEMAIKEKKEEAKNNKKNKK